MVKLLKIDDVAKMYKVSERTVYNWIKRGCPAIKKDGVTRFDEEEVWEWFNNGEGK